MQDEIPEGKVDIHRSARVYARALERFEEDTTVSEANKEHIKRFLKACSLGQTILNKQRKTIQPRRLVKYLGTLRAISRWLENKDFKKISQQDMEQFITSLDRDRLPRLRGAKPGRYAAWSKRDIKVSLRKFYKWLIGDGRSFPDLVSWIDTSIQQSSPPSLTLDEIRLCVERCSSARGKALCWVLFETGARVEEFLNIRLAHVVDKGSHFTVWVEYPKTFRRSVPVFEGAAALAAWLSEHPSRDQPGACLFPLTYSGVRQFLRRLGERTLGKRLTPQLMRDSFATWLASKKVGRYQMCKLMGWSMSSDMPDRYIDRTGLVEEEAIQSIRHDALGSAKRENQMLKTTLTRLEAQCHELQDRVKKQKLGAQLMAL